MKKLLLILVLFLTIFSSVSISQWTLQIDFGDEMLRDVYFLDASEGWIVGDSYVRHTTNGGANWIIQESLRRILYLFY